MTDRRRRFPPPSDIEEHNRSCFIVRDNNGQALAYVYFESEPGRRTAANLLTRDEARRIAANIAKLTGLLVQNKSPAVTRGADGDRGSSGGMGARPTAAITTPNVVLLFQVAK
jgi:hypothetical protein